MKLEIKNLTIVIIVLSSTVLFQSCRQREESTILFDEPQPADVKNTNNFPKSYQGIYINQDSSFLEITSKYLISEDFYLMQIHKNELDSLNGEIVYENGKIIYSTLNDTFIAKKNKDSIYWKEVIKDTLFKVSEENILKKYKGHVFLNYKVDSTSYGVSFLKLEKMKLSVDRINSKEDLVNLNPIEVTTITQDSIKIDTLTMKFHLKRNEFKGVLKSKSFTSPMIYYKIK